MTSVAWHLMVLLGPTHYNTEISMYKPCRPKGLFQFEIIINGLVNSFRFIWIPMSANKQANKQTDKQTNKTKQNKLNITLG